MNCGGLKKREEKTLACGPATGTRHWKELKKLKRRNTECGTKREKKGEARMSARTRVSCLQRKAEGCGEVRGQGEGLALPPGCSTAFRNRGIQIKG